MLYAQIVLGIPVEGPFDYIVPESFRQKINPGSRAWVNFGTKKKIGYVVGLTHKTSVKKLREITEAIDDCPVLDKEMLLLTKQLSEYYCCSWGEVIEAALPEALRRGKRVPEFKSGASKRKSSFDNASITLIHDLDGASRWKVYLERIKESLNAGLSSIVLLPDKNAVLNAKEIIQRQLNARTSVFYRKVPKELDEWLQIRKGEIDIVVGMRSGVFAPFTNLGLIIIDEEQDLVYKQDQVPHYHARQAALMRSGIGKSKLILGSTSPSLESLQLVKKGLVKYMPLSRAKAYPKIMIIDTKAEYLRFKPKNAFFSKYMEDSILSALNSSEKTLIFLNRKGFATVASCNNCRTVLRCPRCNVNLVFHFKEGILNCHYCNFKMDSPKICPNCNSGYIKFSGAGTEKIESELSRIFPQARIKAFESESIFDAQDTDIFVSTSLVTKKTGHNFDLICVLSIDNSLNRADFRSSEKVFSSLMGLLKLTAKKLLIETGFPQHHAFKALLNNDANIFYDKELKERKELNFPPYKHLALVKLRSKIETKAKEASHALFKRLNAKNNKRGINVLSVNPGQPPKLRGNFYWQLLIRSNNPKQITGFLKTQLKDFRHSGIIVTVDIDPL